MCLSFETMTVRHQQQRKHENMKNGSFRFANNNNVVVSHLFLFLCALDNWISFVSTEAEWIEIWVVYSSLHTRKIYTFHQIPLLFMTSSSPSCWCCCWLSYFFLVHHRRWWRRDFCVEISHHPKLYWNERWMNTHKFTSSTARFVHRFQHAHTFSMEKYRPKWNTHSEETERCTPTMAAATMKFFE